MANLTFPSNPTNGQKVTFNGKVFEYDSSTQRWGVTRAQLLGSLSDDVTIDAPTLNVSLSTVALDESGANVYVTYTVDQDVKASITTSGLEDTSATLTQSNNTITITAGSTDFAGGQITLTVTNSRTNVTETINVSATYSWIADPTSFSFDQTLTSSSSHENVPTCVDISPDGTKMYFAGNNSTKIFQYNLNVAYSLTNGYSAQQSGNIIVDNGISMAHDGTKIFALKRGSSAVVYEHSLSTPFQITSLNTTATNSHDFGNKGKDDITLGKNGTRLYMCDGSDNSNILHQMNMSSAYDLSTVSDPNISFNPGSGWRTNAVHLTPNGETMYILLSDSYGVEIRRYTLSTPWEINTATYDNLSFVDAVNLTPPPYGMRFSKDGKYFYIVKFQRIFQRYTTGL
jgi:sugar lactone lactonase YvrE